MPEMPVASLVHGDEMALPFSGKAVLKTATTASWSPLEKFCGVLSPMEPVMSLCASSVNGLPPEDVVLAVLIEPVVSLVADVFGSFSLETAATGAGVDVRLASAVVAGVDLLPSIEPRGILIEPHPPRKRPVERRLANRNARRRMIRLEQTDKRRAPLQ